MATTVTPTKPRDRTRKPQLHVQETPVQIRAVDDGAKLPEGVCGRIVVTALTFNVTDTYGTQFAPGCADRSIGARVAAGRLPLLTDHDNAVRAHVGVVRAMPMVGDAYLGECDVLDTEDGRRFLEYCKACIAAGSVTGASIRFVPRAWENIKVGDRTIERFTEIELRELTVVPLSSVPNTDLLAARADAADGAGGDSDGTADTAADTTLDSERDDATLLAEAARVALGAMTPEARTALLKEFTDDAGDAPARKDAATPPTPPVLMATDEERLQAVRQLL
jgi:hypothetical protein